MATRVAYTTGNFSAAVYNEVTNSPGLHATTTLAPTAGGIFSAAYTAPNTVNQATGVTLYCTSAGTGGTITFTLQENSAGWVDKANVTVNITDLQSTAWLHFRFTAPYTFTATTAGYYRIKVNTAGATGTTAFAADSAGTAIMCLATDNRTTAPTLGTDNLIICAQNVTTPAVITVTGTTGGVGTGASTGVPSSTGRELSAAIMIGYNATLKWDTTADSTLTVRGNINVSKGGNFHDATSVPRGITATLVMDQNGTSVNYGIGIVNGGKFKPLGATITSTSLWHGTYASGVGTAADPLIFNESVDYNVGDEIVILASSNNGTNYNEVESRFIITKNSATSYVVSSTAGGAETALTYTHTNARIVNVTRTFIIKTNSNTQGTYLFNNSATSGDVDIDWVRFETIGSATAQKLGIQLQQANPSYGNMDYSVIYRNLGSGLDLRFSRTGTTTFTGLVVYDSTMTTSVGAVNAGNSSSNKAFIDCYAIKSTRYGFLTNADFNVSYTRCYTNACNTDNATNIGGVGINTGQATFDNCEINACRYTGTQFNSAVNPTRFSNCSIGTKGQNQTYDVNASADSFNEALFDNCNFGSTTTFNGYASMIAGSEVKFNKLNQTANNHISYKKEGIMRSTGSGLADTTVYESGSLGVRLAPEDSSTGMYYQFLVPAKAGNAVSFFGQFRKNTAFGSDVARIDLYLPGLTPGVDTPSDTYTLTNTTEAWQVGSVVATHTGSEDLFATVRIVALSTIAAAYLYLDNFYNGTNNVTALDLWHQGKPSPFMYEQIGDAAAVWATATETLTTPGTTGKKLVDAPTRNQLQQINL